jgi:hypothetical protein
MIKRLKTVLLFGIITGFIACNPGSRKETSISDYVPEKEIEGISNQIFEDLPETGEIEEKLRKAGMDYHADLPNDPAKVNQYEQRETGFLAANLGIYIADLGYLYAYDQRMEARRMMEVSHQMASYLGIEENFKRAMLNRFGKTILQDSNMYHVISSPSHSNTSEPLMEIPQLRVAILTGFYIEKLYLLINFSESELPEKELYDILHPWIILQEKNIRNLLGMLARFDTEIRGAYFYNELFELAESFKKYKEGPPMNDNDIQKSWDRFKASGISDRIKQLRERIVS